MQWRAVFRSFGTLYASVEHDCGNRLTVTRRSTTCEKQIIMPSGSVLYCSERSIYPAPLLLLASYGLLIWSKIAAKERTESSPCLKRFQRPCHLRQTLMGFVSSTRRPGEILYLSALPPLIAVFLCPSTEQKLSIMNMVCLARKICH